MPVTIASACLNDEDFVEAFARCRLPLSSFRHGDHLRLAWIHLHMAPFDEALARVRIGIRQFAAHNGLPQLYHETVTTAWVKLLATHDESSFSEFLASNGHRLNLELLHRFWTPAALDSEAAKAEWLAPDRKELPVMERNR